MNRKSVKLNMDIISAFAEGKVIQYRNNITDTWSDLTEREGLPMNTLEDNPNDFRIKPSPTCRPFANAEECWNEMLKHQPFGWVKLYEEYCHINRVCLNIVSVSDVTDYEFDEAYEYVTFADGSVFGVKVKEG